MHQEKQMFLSDDKSEWKKVWKNHAAQMRDLFKREQVYENIHAVAHAVKAGFHPARVSLNEA